MACLTVNSGLIILEAISHQVYGALYGFITTQPLHCSFVSMTGFVQNKTNVSLNVEYDRDLQVFMKDVKRRS